ncbi:ABC transporter permease [Hoeflea poritis]|uniref:ABC transporter permease n=1 Tax=Hoeflea poritis TaxID=2993659 RepID=A0ABT4VR71_9HYPH|nr:ABC transporter permease [Hoeflea poritis]MDA4847166.1 ABC transporter permease [Hoeflea poritis]
MSTGVKRETLIIGAPASLWLVVLLVIPCLFLLFQSLTPLSGTGLSLENYENLVESGTFQKALRRSIIVSVWVTVLTVLAGYPIALVASRASPRVRTLVMVIVIFPFLLSAVVRAYGWTVILGENGVVNDFLIGIGLIAEPLRLIQNTFAIIIGETHVLLPYMVLSLLTVIQRIDRNLEAAAMSLGASPPVIFFKVVVPLTLPGLLTGMLLVFSLSMTAFATPFLLGGPRSPILTVLMYQYAYTLFDWSKATAVAGVLLVLGLGFVILHRFVSRRLMRDAEAGR